MEIPLSFISPEQEQAFWLKTRYQCLSGGYGSGKTIVALMKLLILLLTFPKYRVAIIRKELKVLKKTTMMSFFKLCPEKLIKSHSDADGETELINGSMIVWLGLDRFAEQDVKSLELNAAFIDQAEELDELIYNHLDTRLGRWDVAEVPKEHLTPDWPLNPQTHRPMTPTYLILAVNPDTEFHWIYREFHPESVKWQLKNRKSHSFINMPSTSNSALPKEVLETMLGKDPEFVRRYVMGEWGFSSAQIHRIPDECIIEPTNDFVKNLLSKALLYRTFDHGEASPSCCLWFAAYKGQHFCYREYYQPDRLISYHRRSIADLSIGEAYSGSYADPDIFRKKSQKQGGRYSVADEYLDRKLTSAAPIAWQPADNGEFSGRNRINEFLQKYSHLQHPLTGEFNASKLYFIKRSATFPYGCENVINETQSQRRLKLGEIEGRPIWSDERDEKISDHSYDCLRYYVTLHTNHDEKRMVKISKFSFNAQFFGNVHGESEMSYGYGTF